MNLGATPIPSATDLAAQITAIFQQYFGRAPAAAGLQFWAGQVTSGVVDDADLPLAIVQGAAPADKTYFMTNFPQLGEEVFGVQTPAAGTAPSGAPIVTTTQPVTASGQQSQTAAVQTAAAASTSSNTPLMLAAAAAAAYFLLEKK